MRIFLLLGAAALALLGCAKFPSGSSSNVTQLIFTMKVNGSINPSNTYMVAIRVLQPGYTLDNNGPIPVVSYPSANGFVAGWPTHFVQFNANLAQPYLINQFVTKTPTQSDPSPIDLTRWTPLGIPYGYASYQQGTNTISFQIGMDQLNGGDVTAANAIPAVQVNFLTMNMISTSSGANRAMDALGDGRTSSGINSPVTILLSASQVWDNARFGNMEPSGDVLDSNGASNNYPDLDIVDWSVEVRRP